MSLKFFLKMHETDHHRLIPWALIHNPGNIKNTAIFLFQKLIDEISVDSLTMFERLFLFVCFVFSSHLTCSKDLWAKER